MADTATDIAVLGAGSWGTALAMLLARNGARVRLWDRDTLHVEALQRDAANQRHLPGVELPASVAPVPDLEQAVTDCALAVIAVPSIGFRALLRELHRVLGDAFDMVWATKGLETDSGKLLHQVVHDELGDRQRYAVLSGPSFAGEVARGLPTAVTIASHDSEFARQASELFHCQRFRTYTSEDVTGVELGGAIKNVLAIAAGISDGLGYGANARAALITRGLAEVVRLGTRLGGHRETFMGLAGVGDLVLTCTDDQSRNRRLGLAIGRGVELEQAVADIGQAVEGLHTASQLDQLARREAVDMPITAEVSQVLNHGKPPAAAVQDLMSRDSKAETV